MRLVVVFFAGDFAVFFAVVSAAEADFVVFAEDLVVFEEVFEEDFVEVFEEDFVEVFVEVFAEVFVDFLEDFLLSASTNFIHSSSVSEAASV